MTAAQIVFLITAGITLIASILVVSLRKMMQSALALILALIGVAAVFAIIGYGFFTVVQVVVYIGAIAILIIFAVMLTQNVMNADESQMSSDFIFIALGAALLFGGLVFILSAWKQISTIPAPLASQAVDPAVLGLGLTDPQGFALPFEAISVLLLAAMIGGIYVARGHHKD